MSRFMVGRQPIFDKDFEVRGYELLFRDPGRALPGGDAMTADVLVHAGLDLGLENFVGNKLAFVNATRPFLVGEQEIPFPPQQTVVEIPGTVAFDADAVSGCQWLVSQGFTLALDDYELKGRDQPLLELVSIVKLDVLALSVAELERDVEECAALGKELVAEKVETHEQLTQCQQLGFGLFQGYLLSRPEIVEGNALSPNKLACVQLVNELCDPMASTEDIQHVIETDAALTYRFLRLAGEGAARGHYRRVTSVRDGVAALGREQMRAWVTLMLLSDTGDAVSEQFQIALARARMCELISARLAPSLSGAAFTVGLVSALDLLLGAPMAEIVESLSLADELVGALTEREGLLGRILSDVLAWEMGGSELRLRCGLSLGSLERSYLEALAWSTHICALSEGELATSGR